MPFDVVDVSNVQITIRDTSNNPSNIDVEIRGVQLFVLSLLGDPNYTTDASRGFFIEENASVFAVPSHTNFTQDLSLNLNTTVSAYATPSIVSNISQTTTTDPSFAPGVAFGINAYIRGLDGTYTYMVPTTGGTPPNPTRPNFNTGAMLFQLPDVSTNLATITGPNQITFNGITKGQGRNKYFEEGSIAGNPTRGVMDSSAWGFSWKINDGAAEYPMVSDGDGSVWESAQSAPAWAADDTTFNNTLDDAFRGSRYWINAWLQDGSGVFYYPKAPGADNFHPTPDNAVEITIPDIETNTPTSVTQTTAVIRGRIAQLSYYASEPAITQYGFYFDISSNVMPTTEEGVVNSDIPFSKRWSEAMSDLTPSTGYHYLTWGYVDSVGISGEVVHFRTLPDEPIIDNSFITIIDSSTVRFTGHMDASGQGDTSANIMGFFYNTIPNPGFGQPDVSNVVSDDSSGVNVSFSGDSTGLLPGETYNVNAYTTIVDGFPDFNGTTYYYEDGSGAAPTGMSFRIPDVSSIFHTIGPAADSTVIVSTHDATTATVTMKAVMLAGGAPMDSSGFGFTWQEDPGAQNYVFPRWDENNYVEETIPGSPWPGDNTAWSENNSFNRGSRYWFNAYIHDGSGIYYYPLKTVAPIEDASAFQFTIPLLATPTPTPITDHEATLKASVVETGTYNSVPPILRHGFYLDANDPTPSTEVGVSTIDPVAGTWEHSATSLPASTLHYVQPFFHIGSSFYGISGEIVSFITDPDFSEVTNKDPSFAWDGITLRGTCDDLGSGPNTGTKTGFFISPTVINPGEGNGTEFIADQPPILGDFHKDISFNDLPGGYVAGETYYYNAYIFDPSATTSNPSGRFRYENGYTPPNPGRHITLGKVDTLTSAIKAQYAADNYKVQFNGQVITLPETSTGAGGVAITDISMGLFISTTIEDPSSGTLDVGRLWSGAAAGVYNDISDNFLHDVSYNFNAFVTDDWPNYYFEDGSANEGSWAPAWATDTTSRQLRIPDISSNVPNIQYDISGDNVDISGQRSATTQTITEYGFYLSLDGSGGPGATTKVSSQTADPDNTFHFTYNKLRPIDISFASLGGDVSYNVNAYLIVDNIELSGNTTDISFNTPAWPKPRNIDISRNVGQGPSGEEGYAILRGQVLDLGFGTENVGGANDVNLGFYIHDNIEARDGLASKGKVSYDASTAQVGDIFKLDSSTNAVASSDYLSTGVIYYVNAFIEKATAWWTKPQYYEGPNYLGNIDSTTEARLDAETTASIPNSFPDGMGFSIPKLQNQNPVILDSCAVQFKLNIDSSGHLIGNANPGTEELGFFWSDDPSKCYNQATNVHNEQIYTWTGDNGIQTVDVSALPQGITRYYTAYTEYTAQDRGEGIDGDDIWYPSGYIKQDTTLVYKDFCIGDPSFTELPTNITGSTTTLHLDLSGDYPIPQPNLNGITYWHHGNNVLDSSNEIFGTNPMPDVGVGENFALTSLTSGLKYSAIPFIRQDLAGISGEEISWYTLLNECVVQNDPVTNITKDSATLNATLSDNPPWNKDPGFCTDHGFVYTKTDDDNYLPVIGVDTLKQMPGPGKTDTGSFGGSPDGNIAGLDLNRQYNVRTYANNTRASEPTGGGLVYNPVSAPSSIFYTLLPEPTMNSTVTSTVIDVSNIKLEGQITVNPDNNPQGQIEKYGFVWRQYDPSSEPLDLHDIVIPTVDDCDGSNNLLVGTFSEGMPFDFETELTAGAPRSSFDLSSNRMYYVRSYAQNRSTYTDISGVGYNTVDASFTTKLQLPVLTVGDIEYPEPDISEIRGAMGWSITAFKQGDPTIWGGLTEFGFIWDTKAGIDASGLSGGLLTLEHAALCVGPDRAGMYRRGDHNYLPQDFSNNFLNAVLGGIHPDASFATQSLGNDPAFKTPEEYLGSSGLGLPNSFPGLPAPDGIGAADASNTPFVKNANYIGRAYAYVKSIIYGNEDPPGTNPEYLIYSEQMAINFNVIPAKIEADYQGGLFDWSVFSEWAPPLPGGGQWSRPLNISFDSADLSGNLLSNPLNGIFAYGYLWWDGGETIFSRNLLTWPGKPSGQISPEIALQNGFFSLDSADGSSNYFLSEPPGDPAAGGIYPQSFPTLSENITTYFYNTKPTTTIGGTDPSGLMVNRTIWMRPYVWNRDPEDPFNTDLWRIGYGDVGRLELENYPSFGVDMIDPLENQESIDNNIRPNTARMFGRLVSNELNKITDYGFCWREVVSNGSQYNYATEELDENVVYPAPTIYDNSMVSLFVSDNSFNLLRSPGCDPSSHAVGGLFPGLSDPSFANMGMTQAPPSFKIDERPQGWSFFYNIGDGGKELKEDCGAFDPARVGFDASSGVLKPLTYYFVRSYAVGPPDETAETDVDEGERKSGIKYGPIWYGGTESVGHLKKGFVLLTAPFGPCELGEIRVLDYNYKNVDISGSIITNPSPPSLRGAGAIIAEGHQQPTLNSSGLLRFLTVGDVLTNPPLPVEWIIEDCANPILLPNTQYSIGLWADNTDNTGDQDQGGISYSPNYKTFTTDYAPTPEISIHPAIDISWNRATFEGEIISNVGEYISEMGFCYGISGENASPPRFGDCSFVTVPMDELMTFPSWAPGTGLYSKPVTNLITGVSYEIVAFVKSVYSDPSVVYSSTFETLSLPNPPAPLMGAIIQVPQDTRPDPWNEALFYGSISDTSGSDLIDRHGFIWTTQDVSRNGLQQDPAHLFPAPGVNDLQLSNYENILDLGLISDWPTDGLVRDGSYNFTGEIKGLSPGILYYIRSFASINPTGYGEVYVFRAPLEPCKCKKIPKPLGAQSMPACGMSKAMRCAQTIKIKGGPPLPTNSQGITANLPGGRGKESC